MQKVVLVLTVIVMLLSASCQAKSYPCEVLEALDSQEFYFRLDLAEQGILEIAQKGDCFMLRDYDSKVTFYCNGENRVCLFPNEKRYTTVFDQYTMDVRKLRLKGGAFAFQQSEQIGEETVFHCIRNGADGFGFGEKNPYRFYYQDKRLTKIEIDATLPSGEILYTPSLPVLEFRSTIPEDLVFKVPEDYEWFDLVEEQKSVFIP